MKLKNRALLILCLLFSAISQAQQLPFYAEISAFKREDSLRAPQKDAILFIGSSSFTYWKNVQNSFPGYPIINRGFGGSSLTHQILYAQDIIFRYKPKQIVIYCGENDLAESDTVSANTVLNRFITLFTVIRKKMPSVSIAFVSLKPSPSRQHLMPRMEEVNKNVRLFLQSKRRTSFIDIYSDMLDSNGNPVGALFKADRLHMNEKGYAIWQKAISPHLVK